MTYETVRESFRMASGASLLECHKYKADLADYNEDLLHNKSINNSSLLQRYKDLQFRFECYKSSVVEIFIDGIRTSEYNFITVENYYYINKLYDIEIVKDNSEHDINSLNFIKEQFDEWINEKFTKEEIKLQTEYLESGLL